ncbi:MAG: ABC-F family ATP-binding cassette domain-containing protein [Candidatus Zixiibacteriota bacterium]
MTLLTGENIFREFEDRILFNGLSFTINDDDRIGLVGPNGIGKTTLFDMMAGKAAPEQGKVYRSKNCRIGYIEQEFGEAENETLFDFVQSARMDLLDIKTEISEIEHKLLETPEDTVLLGRLGDYQDKFESLGGYSFETEIKIILIGLGFPENRFHNRLYDFSGGEKNRAALARILVGNANLLLLDEPTNHLDIESTIWLEEYLINSGKAYIIVSHDRTFLANTIKKVWEISGKKIEQYFNGFDSYITERKERQDLIKHQYKHQQEEIKRIEDFIRKNMAGQKTKQAQSKQKYLARIKRIELPQSDRNSPTFSVESSGRSHNLILGIESGYFGYGNHPLIEDISFNLYRGDRVGFIGRNGSGKTTFLKTILGDLEMIEGEIKLGSNVDIAYFDQELSELDENNTVIDELWQVDPLIEAGTLRSFLARFGFIGDEVFKKIFVLSGGEKTKLALAKLLFKPANFLIFDEPTNHLDIDARQALEEALKQYDGAFLIVSHDRFFLDQVVDKIIAVENNHIRTFIGNYSYYKEKIDSEMEFMPSAKKEIPEDKLIEYAEFKEQSRQKGRLKKELRSVKSKIEDNEKLLSKLEQEINHTIPKTNWEKLAEVTAEKTRVEELLLNLYHSLEELEKLNAENSDPER